MREEELVAWLPDAMAFPRLVAADSFGLRRPMRGTVTSLEVERWSSGGVRAGVGWLAGDTMPGMLPLRCWSTTDLCCPLTAKECLGSSGVTRLMTTGKEEEGGRSDEDVRAVPGGWGPLRVTRRFLEEGWVAARGLGSRDRFSSGLEEGEDGGALSRPSSSLMRTTLGE